ncbi:Asp-tRNA(Asn)/Glu-tRNA(Gln) amidotransferase subunit GatB [Syntrophus aciditrophicus]|uniref:Aspartyl/glutamyl-tRNA(Asn/Gln) amidotransferase subunit B 1 n=1 Tax=Syntrophus aciditrophicus (strain SB) TaxID=56780 RepID=GATB1_SYNAS|nr:Asp-tRNA(Asn)/Glu-tRNA(Gln) amidotransferase subunit GatB [Syntrophus aciditrophicus]Q2LPY6.1 RecName: Full=Aspartyl/glutamyl-tRNA(Asn/Gln) amidotransferase subunit B 1; Short=Asp/Glu-ADT subunit B 1 [Syntrophus aciditrophicus SB]ABC76329.1 aspartyl/glutamyl-tRNA(Asn/Gln) amidotransferase subunit B [Syntrophus aciditrophicus SB]
MEFEAVIGLEIHIELNCPTKLFCDCPNNPGDEPNVNTCPICLWFPGAIPRLSQAALEKASLLCLGLGAELQPRSAFDQKVYYYPDLPKGYQLSQAHLPLARGGGIDITDENGRPKRLRIHHIHMEEDVAKLVHEIEGRTPISLVDFNRAGAPLVEIVSEPDFRTPHDAMEFLKALRTQVRYVGASECSMENGTMRVDANISVRPRGTDQMNTKVEVKNMNSIRHVGDAVAYEISRQSACVSSGEAVVLHTRLWDPDRKATFPMRAKFEGPCVPDPSVPFIDLSPEWIEKMRARLPEMPAARAERFVARYGLTDEEAVYLSADPETASYFEALIAEKVAPRTAMHWLTTQLLAAVRERGQELSGTPVTPARFAALLKMLAKDEINANAARQVLIELFDCGESPEKIVEARGIRQVSDHDALEGLIDRVLGENPAAVADYRGGQGKAAGFLIGKVMQASGGKANPKIIRELLTKKLDALG